MALPVSSRAIAIDPDRPGAVHRTEIAVPELSASGVLVQTLQVGVCGTDREIIHGHIGRPPAGERELVLGHEVLGRVVATGADVTDLAPGDLVTASVRRPDGCPACQAGEPDMCLWGEYEERGIVERHGFMTEYWVEERDWVFPLPDHLAEVGVLVEPLTVVEKAVRQIDLIQRRLAYWEPGTALVIGAGPIGILATLLLRSRDIAVTTAARTPQPNRAAQVVERAGAAYVSTREESLEALGERLGNIDIILECSGASEIVFEGMRMLGRNGVLVPLGVTDPQLRAEVGVGRITGEIVGKNKTIVGSVNAGIEDFPNAIERLGTFERLWPGLLGEMITERIPFDGDVESIVAKPPRSIKTVIEFGG